MVPFETVQSLEQQQELLELETENERLLLNILPRHVVPFFVPSRRHTQVYCLLCARKVTTHKLFTLCVFVLAQYSSDMSFTYATAPVYFLVFSCSV